MADPNIRIKRSSVEGKRPSISQLQMGELALNTNDGRLFTRKYNVGIGSTVTLLNPWTENIGGSVYYNDGNVGIGLTNPTSKLEVNGNVSISSTVGIGTIIDIIPYDNLNSGTLSWEGSAGQLFSITNNLTSGSIFSVNDVSGIPSIDVNADGTINLAPFIGNVGIGTTNPSYRLESISSSSQLHAGPTKSTTGLIVNCTDTTYNRSATLSNPNIDGTGGGVAFFIENNSEYTGIYVDNFGNPSFRSTRSATPLSIRSAGDITLSSGNAEKVRVTSTGNVLVGSATSTGTASQPLQVTGGAYVSGNVGVGVTNPSSQLHITGQFQSTQANSTTTGGGQIYLNGATGNRIDFNINGAAAPSFTTRSVGTKIVLYPDISGSKVDYAFGIEGATLWSSVSDSSAQFKWYAGTTNIATLSGTGNLTIGGGVSGATATPTNINLGLNYSNGTTRDKLKIYLYNSGSEQYGFGVGSAGDVQYHSNAFHDFYIGNVSAVRINGSRNLLIGSQTDTGTTSQPLQVTGGAYVSGNVGIGSTNPTEKLEVSGNIKANNFYKGTTPLITGVGISSNSSRVSTAITDFNFVGAQVTAGLTTATVTIVKVLTVGRRDTTAATINAVGTGITMLLRSGSVATLTF